MKTKINPEVVDWLLAGDPAIQWHTRRYFPGSSFPGPGGLPL